MGLAGEHHVSKAHAVGEDGLTSGAPGSLRFNFLSGAWPSLFTSIIKYICLFAECSLGTDCSVIFLPSAFPGGLYTLVFMGFPEDSLATYPFSVRSGVSLSVH